MSVSSGDAADAPTATTICTSGSADSGIIGSVGYGNGSTVSINRPKVDYFSSMVQYCRTVLPTLGAPPPSLLSTLEGMDALGSELVLSSGVSAHAAASSSSSSSSASSSASSSSSSASSGNGNGGGTGGSAEPLTMIYLMLDGCDEYILQLEPPAPPPIPPPLSIIPSNTIPSNHLATGEGTGGSASSSSSSLDRQDTLSSQQPSSSAEGGLVIHRK